MMISALIVILAITSIFILGVQASNSSKVNEAGSASGSASMGLAAPQQAKVDTTAPVVVPTHTTMLLDGGVSTQAEQIQWSAWHEAFHRAVIENQTELLKHNKSIRYGLAVVEYKVTKARKLTVHALPHDDPTYKKMAAEALSGYNMDALRKDMYLAPNAKFDELVVKCYERLNNKEILDFPANSERSEVSDTRWHIAGIGVGNYVHWRTDDYEQVVGGQ